MATIGIYKITNLINSKSYIGQSKNIEHRWQMHRVNAFNQNSEVYNYPIYCAMRKYDLNNFTFTILEICTEAELDDREIY